MTDERTLAQLAEDAALALYKQQDYGPLGIVEIRDAMIDVAREHAEIVQHTCDGFRELWREMTAAWVKACEERDALRTALEQKCAEHQETLELLTAEQCDVQALQRRYERSQADVHAFRRVLDELHADSVTWYDRPIGETGMPAYGAGLVDGYRFVRHEINRRLKTLDGKEP